MPPKHQEVDMKYKFVIDGVFYKSRTLPGLNEYLNACSTHPLAGNKMKQDYQMIINNKIRSQLKRLKIDKPVIIHYAFYESDKVRDKSNIFALAAKYIEDSLQVCGVLKGDGWQHVENFTHEFHIDRHNPRIEVVIEEIEIE